MGDTLQEIEQIEQAIAAFEQALAIKPDHPVVKNNLRQLTSSQ